MKKYNPANERIKRKYFDFLKEAKRHSEPTIDSAAKALNRFEVYTKFRDFKTFRFEQAIAFKKHLANQKGQRSGEKLSKSTLHATLNQLKRFFKWLSREPGYKSRSVFRCRVFQPFRQGNPHRHGQSAPESTDIGADQTCYQHHARRYRN